MELLDEVLLNASYSSLLALSLLKASIVLGIAQLFVSVAKKLPAGAKHLILTAGIAAFLLIPTLTLLGPSWKFGVPVEGPAIAETSIADSFGRTSGGLSSEGLSAPDSSLAVGNTVPPTLLLWSFVASIILFRLIRAAIHVRSVVARAAAPSARLSRLLAEARGRARMDQSVRLLRSDRIRVPMVWGFRSGTLLLPVAAEEWPDEQIRTTFLHELGHLQRMDYLSLAVMNLASTLFWFHPQIWFARRRALLEGERACDDLVLGAGERPSAYASHLLHVASLTPKREPLAALLAMSRPSQLEDRMHAILSPSINRHAMGGPFFMKTLVSFLLVLLPLSAFHLVAEPVAPVAPAAPKPVTAEAIAPAPPMETAEATAEPSAIAAAAPQSNFAPQPAAASVAPETPVIPNAGETATPVVAPRSPESSPSVSLAPALEAARAYASPHHEIDAPNPVPAPPAQQGSFALAILSESDLASRPFRVLDRIETKACTLKLKRPRNTGDPSVNPAETLAITRLVKKADARGADAVANLRCFGQIEIGVGCPTSVGCQGDAIAFEN